MQSEHSEEKEIEEENVPNYSISDRLKISVPQHFLDPVTHKILVFPVTLENGLTYEAVNAIKYLTADTLLVNNDWNLHTKDMYFNGELYIEIRDYFEKNLFSSELSFLEDADWQFEYKILATYATGLAQHDLIFINIKRWCSASNLEICDISIPDAYSSDVAEHINFNLVMDLPPEMFDSELTIEDINPCSCKNLKKIPPKLYSAPVIGFLASLYSVVGVSNQAWAFTYSSTFGFMLGVGSRVLRCDYSGACYAGTLSAATAVGVTALKYVFNTENTLITGATVTIGVPLLIYGVERLSGRLAACNRFSLWRAVPTMPPTPPTPPTPATPTIPLTPESLNRVIELVPRPS